MKISFKVVLLSVNIWSEDYTKDKFKVVVFSIDLFSVTLVYVGSISEGSNSIHVRSV